MQISGSGILIDRHSIHAVSIFLNIVSSTILILCINTIFWSRKECSNQCNCPLSKSWRRQAWTGRACCRCPRKLGQSAYQKTKLSFRPEGTATGCGYQIHIYRESRWTNSLKFEHLLFLCLDQIFEVFLPGIDIHPLLVSFPCPEQIGVNPYESCERLFLQAKTLSIFPYQFSLPLVIGSDCNRPIGRLPEPDRVPPACPQFLSECAIWVLFCSEGIDLEP